THENNRRSVRAPQTSFGKHAILPAVLRASQPDARHATDNALQLLAMPSTRAFHGVLRFPARKEFHPADDPGGDRRTAAENSDGQLLQLRAAIDLAAGSVCPHCGSPISIMDTKQSQELLVSIIEIGDPQCGQTD